MHTYRAYTYEIIPIAIGTLGAIPKSLKRHLEDIRFKKDMNDTIRRMQLAVLKGIVKNCQNCSTDEEIEDLINNSTITSMI